MTNFYSRRILLVTFLIFCKELINAQTPTKTTTTHYIDSIVSRIDTTTYIQKTIEGTITTKPSKDNGSSSETYFFDTLSKRLIKVEEAKSLHDKRKRLTFVELTTFYYDDDRLIMVRSSRFDTFGYPSFSNSNSYGKYYYDDVNIISSQETGYKHGGIIYLIRAKDYRDLLSKKFFSDL